MKCIAIISLVCTIFTINNIVSKAIFFDLYGVLIDKRESRARKYINAGDYIAYAFAGVTKNASLERRYEDFLAYVAQHDQTEKSITFADKPLPAHIVDWLTGNLESKKLISFLHEFMEDHKSFFLSQTETKLVKSIINLMKPEVLSAIVVPLSAMVKVMQDCKKQQIDGKPKHEIYILCNWDRESLDLMQQSKELSPIFTVTDGDHLLISSKLGIIIPSDELFAYLVKERNINPADCIIITREKKYMQMIEDHGMKAILHKTMGQTRKELKRLMVLPS